MDRMDYFLEVYGALPRAGPGDDASTERALRLAENLPPAPRILDLGCGPGVQTVALLRLSGGTVVALDLFPKMLARTRAAAQAAGVADRLETVQADMNAMTFAPASFDLVWSEGAIYFLGFERGLARVRELVKPGGYVAVTEAVWLEPDPPAAAREFWRDYPEVDTVARKLAVIERLGYEEVGHFVLPASSWTDRYYDPMEARIAELAPAWAGIPEAEAVLAEARTEIATFRACSRSFSYAFFVMRRPAQ